MKAFSLAEYKNVNFQISFFITDLQAEESQSLMVEVQTADIRHFQVEKLPLPVSKGQEVSGSEK